MEEHLLRLSLELVHPLPINRKFIFNALFPKRNLKLIYKWLIIWRPATFNYFNGEQASFCYTSVCYGCTYFIWYVLFLSLCCWRN